MENSGKLEEQLTRIKEILRLMQEGEKGFDEQMELFQEGVSLVKNSQEILTQSELQVKQLLEGELQNFLPQEEDE